MSKLFVNSQRLQPPLKKEMLDLEFPLNKRLFLKGPFFIKGKMLTNGTYEFKLFRLDKYGIYTVVFSFQTETYLSLDYKILCDGTFFKFVFETDPLNTEIIYSIEYAFLFSESFGSETDLWNSLKLMPAIAHIDRQIFYIDRNYWYHLISVGANLYELYLVEAYREKHGFNSTFQIGDTVITKIIVDSSNVPYVMNDEEGNPIIASADKDFVPIPIQLPIDDISSC